MEEKREGGAGWRLRGEGMGERGGTQTSAGQRSVYSCKAASSLSFDKVERCLNRCMDV